MTAHASRRALRVGVLLGDQLVEERVFRHGAPVTFGQSLRCSLSVPGDGIPAEHVLFAHDDGKLLLRLTASMKGRIAEGDAIRTELHAGPGDHGVWTIPIAQGARGRLQIGDATLLFQEIAAPAAAPRPTLPASMRTTLADRVDRRLAAILGASLLAHIGIAAYAWMTDADDTSMLSPPIAQTYRHETIEVVLPDEPPPSTTPTATDPEPGPAVAAPVSPVQTPRPIGERPRVTSSRPAPTLSDEDIARFASMLSGNDETPNGTAGTMNDRKPGADLNMQIAEAKDRQLRIGDGTEREFREQPGPRLGTVDNPIVDDPTQVVNNEPKGRETNPGRVVIRPLPGPKPTTTLTVEVVLDKINTVYMSGLQRCYRKGLAGDATLSGKVIVSFTVTERGGLEDSSASGVTSEVDTCVEQLMQGWRFPIPRDKDGDPDTASFKVGLALTPS